MMIIQKFHVLLLPIIFLPTLSSATTPVSKFPIALPNCTDQCGDVKIPYPFGTTQDCYGSHSFVVICNDSFSPPKLFMQSRNTQHEVSEISLDGQLRILQPVARDCYSPNATNIPDHGDYNFQLPDYLTFNNTANKFTVLGCNTIGFMAVKRINGSKYKTSCTTTCSSKEDLSDDQLCGGLGCCQFSTIAKDAVRIQLDIQPSDKNNTENTWKFSKCSYGVLVEERAYTFSPGNLTNFNSLQKFPIVVDWAIGNETCESARKENSSNYACKSANSECYTPENGFGYRCRCKEGYGGNPYLIDGCQDIDECLQHPCFETYCHNTIGSFDCFCPKGYDNGTREGDCVRRRESHIYKLVAAAAVGVILAILLACLSYLEFRRRRSKKMKHIFFLRNGGMLLQEKLKSAGTVMSSGMERQITSNNGHMARIFSSVELRKATDNFCDNMIIGKGGFGIVYRGYLYDKKMVAIKKSKEVDSRQIEQFINEVFVLSQISHRNVVKLLGCCLETQVPLLVYEFINNGTLSDHIHYPENKSFLHWDLRLKIANETADVLSYLHSAASTPIIHRDVKSTNILLDNDFSAKVSDFGASRLVPMDQSRLSTMVLGTAGYLDPEYMQTGQLTEKSDVYSFGVVLVELITGIKAFRNDMPQEDKSLANFFLGKLREKCLVEILDNAIMCAGNEEQITGVAKLASVCLNVDGEDRPSMKEVAMELENLRLGRKHSFSRHEYNAEKTMCFGGNRLDSFVNVEGYSEATSTSTHSNLSWGNAKLSGGR